MSICYACRDLPPWDRACTLQFTLKRLNNEDLSWSGVWTLVPPRKRCLSLPPPLSTTFHKWRAPLIAQISWETNAALRSRHMTDVGPSGLQQSVPIMASTNQSSLVGRGIPESSIWKLEARQPWTRQKSIIFHANPFDSAAMHHIL